MDNQDTRTSSEALAPCPFCGGQPKSDWMGDTSVSGDDGYWFIECCDIHVHRDAEAEAIAAWNTRPQAQSARSSELVERLREKARRVSETERWLVEQKSLRQTDNPERRTDLYSWPTPGQTFESEVAAHILALTAQLTRQSEALRQGAAWFAEYADHHEQLAKAAGHHVGKERNAKAERNRERAAFLAQAYEARHD